MCTALENLKKEGILKSTIQGMMGVCREMGCPEDMIISKLKKKFNLNDNQIKHILKNNIWYKRI